MSLAPAIRTRIARLYPFTFARRRVLGQWFGCSVADIPDGTDLLLGDGRHVRVRSTPPYWGVYFLREHEPVETQVVRAVIRPGDIALDIGANFGWYSTLLCALVGDRGHVYAFEPLPAVASELRENIRRNAWLSRCTINNFALGETNGPIALAWSDVVGDTHASRFGDGPNRVPVEQRRLDDYVAESELGRIDFVKCDAEGAEMHVLEGARETLRRPHKPVLLFEHQKVGLGSDNALIAELRALGYNEFWECLRRPASLTKRIQAWRYPRSLEGLRRVGLLRPLSSRNSTSDLVRNVLAFERVQHGGRMVGLL